jgi:signal transduction histidine kinase
VYALLGQVGFWLLNPPGGAAFYPPAGLALAVLVLTPRKTWPVWLAAFATAHSGVHLLHHRPVAAVVGYTLADMAEPVAGALLLAAAVHHHRGPRAALISFAVLPVMLAPVLGAVIGASSKVLLAPGVPGSESWWYYARNWWVSDALGALVIGSLILAWSRPMAFEDRMPLTAVATVAALAAAAIVASGVLWHYPLIFVALPCLVWAAFFGGARAMTTVGAAAALAADWVAITGRAGRLLASAGPAAQLQFLQLFLGVTFLTGLFLAVEIAERRRGEERAQAAIQLTEAERHSITQETHDIVGHGLNAILLQVGAARRVLNDDPAKVRELLTQTEELGRRAFDDLDTALAIVGDGQTPPHGHGLAELRELVSTLRDATLVVDLRVENAGGELSTLVDLSVYGIVREALTNVLKHAPRAKTAVTVRFDDDAVYLSVVDDGGPEAGDRSYGNGRGIAGMRERAAALGGTLDVGPNPGGGFTVAAMLPRALQ